MTQFDPTDAYFHKVCFEVYCPLVTIAEQFYACCSDPFDEIASGPYIDGKKSHIALSTSRKMCKYIYGWSIEILGQLFCTELKKDDYPVSRIRVHIQYKHPEIAQFIYDRAIIKRPDIELETPDTIGLDCMTLDEIENLERVFLECENQWAQNIQTDINIERYNNDNRLENSTHSLITSICVMIMFIGLISKCCV